LYVEKPPQDIPKSILLEKLAAEAPAFTHTLLSWKLPPLTGRLGLDIIDTPSRLRLADLGTPPFIHAVLSHLSAAGEFHGTASELSTFAARQFGTSATAIEFPSDFRKVCRLLDAHGSLLRKRGYVLGYTEKTKRGRLITITAKR
jgi:hypothetical protein